MTGNTFVNGDWSRIHRCRAPKVAKFVRRFRHITDAVLLQARGRREVIVFSKTESAQIFRSRPKRVVLDPIRHREDAAFFEKFPDLEFFIRRVLDPAVDVGRDFKQRHIFVPVFLVRFKGDRSIPVLSSHRQQFLRRERHERDVPQKPNVGVSAERSLLRKLRQSLFELLLELLQRVRRALACAIQFVAI